MLLVFIGLVCLMFCYDICYKNQHVLILNPGQNGIDVTDQQLNTESPRLDSFDSDGNVIELPDMFAEPQDEIAEKLKAQEKEL